LAYNRRYAKEVLKERAILNFLPDGSLNPHRLEARPK
jgi:hypothetical protein